VSKLLTLININSAKWAPQACGPLCFAHAAQSIATPLDHIIVIHLFSAQVHVFRGTNITGASCAAGDLSMNSKCYRKFDHSSHLSWYSASNECLSRGGSLAVFTDIGRPSDNDQLTDWLTTSSTDKTYWIGLIRSWWMTTDEGNIRHYCTDTLYKFFI